MALQAVSDRSTHAAAAASHAGGQGHASQDMGRHLRRQWKRQWQRLQARLRSTWRPLTVALLAPPHVLGDAAAVDAALDALDAWADGHEGVYLNVQLSSRWLLCCATPDATDAAQAREMAQQQWAHYFGLEAEQLHADWLITEVMQSGGASKGQIRLVCAVPQALVNGLKDVARERGLNLQAAMPWWAEGLQAAWDACLADTPAATQPEGTSRQWAWSEPGLLTRAQASVREGRWVLERVWVEVHAADMASSHATTAAAAPDLCATLSPLSQASALVWQLLEEDAA